MSKMIELHDIDVPGFLSVLDSCEGNVYLMTRDGDKLNLKSKAVSAHRSYVLDRRKDLRSLVVCDNEAMNPSCSALTFAKRRNAR